MPTPVGPLAAIADDYVRRWTSEHPGLFGSAGLVWCVVVVAFDRWATAPFLTGVAVFGVGVAINAFAIWRVRARPEITMLHIVGYLAMLAGTEIGLLALLRAAGLVPFLWR